MFCSILPVLFNLIFLLTFHSWSPYSLSVLVGQLVYFVKAENGSVLADVFGAYVTAAAFAYAALHSKLHGGVNLSFVKA